MDQGEKNQAAAGNPKLVTIGGVSYCASPLDDRANGALLDFVKRRLKSPLLAIAEDIDKLPPAMQEKVIRAAVEAKQTGGATPNGESYRMELLKPDGCAFLAWLMIRRDHPTVPLEALQAAITEENVVETLANLFDASGLASLGKAQAGANG